MIRAPGSLGSSRNGMTAAAPECRISSSSPVLPSGKRTRSMSRFRTLPSYRRREAMVESRSRGAPCCLPSGSLVIVADDAERTELQVGQSRLHLGAIAHRQDLQPVEMQVALCRSLHALSCHGADSFPIGVEEVVRQPQGAETCECTRNRVRRLEANGKHTIEIRRAERELV